MAAPRECFLQGPTWSSLQSGLQSLLVKLASQVNDLVEKKARNIIDHLILAMNILNHVLGFWESPLTLRRRQAGGPLPLKLSPA
jgi:hypothetical protein